MLKIMSVLIVLILLFPPGTPCSTCSIGEEEVLIAVASEGKTLKDSVSPVAGRCPYFLFIDSTGKILEVIDNPYKAEGGSAGVSAANFLAEKKVTIVVAEKFGGKMKDVLQAKKITCFEWEGIVEEAVKNDKTQLLKQVDRNLNPESYESYRKLVNIEPNGREKEFVLFTVKKGKDRVAALFLSPASEEGRSTLRLEDNMWLYIPNVGKPVRITSLQSVVGGIFNNADILRLDYAEEYDVSTVEEMEGEYLLHLKAKTNSVAYDRLKMWVDKERTLPTKIECLTAASMLIKTIYFKQIKDFGGGIVRPSVIETDSPLHQGYKSIIVFAGIKQRQFKDEVFTLSFLPNLESIR